MSNAFITSLVLSATLAIACGGPATPAEEPEETSDYDEAAFEDSTPAERQTEQDEVEQDEGGQAKGAVAEPEFKDGMTVDEAINAVPQGTQRVNVDQDDLAEPLKDPKVYEPCKPAANAHWNVRVAVWQGRAVGIDIKTTPNNPRLSECIATQIKALTWRDKVPSLNTVEYAF